MAKLATIANRPGIMMNIASKRYPGSSSEKAALAHHVIWLYLLTTVIP